MKEAKHFCHYTVNSVTALEKVANGNRFHVDFKVAEE